MTSSKESHELIDKVLIRKPATLEGHRQDINIRLLRFSQLGLLLLDQVPTDGANLARRFVDILIAANGQKIEEPDGHKETQQSQQLRLLRWLHDLGVGLGQGVVLVLDSSKVSPHPSHTDDIQRRPRRPRSHLCLSEFLITKLGSHGPRHLPSLVPKDGIEIFDMAECESRRQVTPLNLVFLAFGEQNAEAQDTADGPSDLRWLLKSIVVGDKNLSQCFG